MRKVFLFVSLLVAASMYAGMVTVSRGVSSLAQEYGWEQGSGNNCYLDFQLDDNISIVSNTGNAKYLKTTSEECMRYYQYGKGELTIRAKAGVIIQSVQFDYYQGGVITNNYGTDGTNTPEANQVKSGVPFKVDGNKVTLYMGSTDNTKNAQVRITKYTVTYFVPDEGVSITKSAKDLGYEFGLKNNTPYQDIALNNAIKLHADNGGTLKYYNTSGSLNCYRWTGAIDIVAREGVKIHYVKITYSGGPRAVLTKNWGTDGKAIPAADRIASDSILYVNSDSLKIYVGDTTLLGSKSGTSPTLGITKIYVNYTDSNAIMEDFSLCPVEKSDSAVAVPGMAGIYDWQLTGFSREKSHHLYYNQTTQLYIGRTMVANNEEGGMKEVSFEWFASNSAKNAKFVVKAGEDTIAAIDSAATGGWYPVTYTKTDIKRNGAFAIEVDTASGSQVEIHRVSIIPYLRFAMREDSINAEEETTYDVRDILIDHTEDAANIVYTIESDETSGATISSGVVDLSASQQAGAVVVKAAWEEVAVHFTLHVKVAGPSTKLDDANANANVNRKVIVNSHLRIYKDGKCYSVLGELIR